MKRREKKGKERKETIKRTCQEQQSALKREKRKRLEVPINALTYKVP